MFKYYFRITGICVCFSFKCMNSHNVSLRFKFPFNIENIFSGKYNLQFTLQCSGGSWHLCSLLPAAVTNERQQ